MSTYISVTSHGLHLALDSSASGTLRHFVFETLPGETFAFRGKGQDDIQSVSHNGQPIALEAGDYQFTPAEPGLHQLDVTFASGRERTIEVAAFAEAALNRITVPRTRPNQTRGEFIAKARVVLRSIARHGLMTADGNLPGEINPAIFGGTGEGITYKDAV